MRAPVVTFLSDYGLADPFVGICHAVIASIAPEARVVDLHHGVPRHDVRAGALVLHDALPFLPVGVHLGVVDPDVGAQRRSVALRTAGERLLVGPDNGLLTLAAERDGGVVEAVELAASPFRLEPVSATFHGRDLFAPVAARLAAGAPLGEAGEPLDPAELVALELPTPRLEGAAVVAHALVVDRYGNVALDADHALLPSTGLRLGQPVSVLAGDRRTTARFARTFSDVAPGELLVYEDAGRRLALAVNLGSAAEALGVGPDAELRLAPA